MYSLLYDMLIDVGFLSGTADAKRSFTMLHADINSPVD